ncbi:hypothetical protein BJ138DRAFT_1227753, partial [Hygrophoropsis aurantiaca]
MPHGLDDNLSQRKHQNNRCRKMKDSGWKACVWVAAAQALAGSEVQSGGAAKKAKGCSDHWSLLKNNCLIVQKLHGLSGFGWDDSRCLVVAPADVWERYIKDHSDAE